VPELLANRSFRLRALHIVSALIALQIAWFGYWGIAFPLAVYGIADLPLPGTSTSAFAGSVNYFNVGLAYFVWLNLVTALVLIWRGTRWALLPYSIAAFTHLYLWVNLVYNSQYSGIGGYFYIVAEGLVLYLMLSRTAIKLRTG
jgi:hypothetical protein